METYDYAIVGAGMAGASIAAELLRLSGEDTRIVILEAEDHPGYHTTGRSAAFWSETYGGPDIAPLSLASKKYLDRHGFLHERGALHLASQDDPAAADRFLSQYARTGAKLRAVGRDALLERVPGLRPRWIGGVEEPGCSDIDVAALHQHYLGMAKRGGARLRCRARLTGADRSQGQWTITLERGDPVRARVLVNAAGAWADCVAALSGAQPVGITPYRRTIVQLELETPPPAQLPLVLDLAGTFYFKPDGNRLWLSPHDEVESAACDAAPDELSVAQAIDRFQHAVDWPVRRVESRWAGLRSFAPDRLPVYGFDPAVENFFWFAGQGGFGIQTAPAAARLAAQIAEGTHRDAMTLDLHPERYDPGRFG